MNFNSVAAGIGLGYTFQAICFGISHQATGDNRAGLYASTAYIVAPILFGLGGGIARYTGHTRLLKPLFSATIWTAATVFVHYSGLMPVKNLYGFGDRQKSL